MTTPSKTTLIMPAFILITVLGLRFASPWGIARTTLQSPPAYTTNLPIITRTVPAFELLGLINAERVSQGLASLSADTTLTQVAEAHSLDMATRNYLDHVNPEGDRAGDRLDKAGYQWSSVGEVIAGGYASPQSALTGWLNSPSHRAVLLNPVFVEIGAGYAFRAGTHYKNYWCVVVAIPK